MFVVRYKELLLFIMSVGYAELYNCKVSIISAYIKVWSTNINKKTNFPFMG